MANRFSVNPLGGFNVGSALQGLGQQFREQKRYDTQQQEQEDLRAFAVQAQSGDPIAMKELFARDPRLAMAIEQREAEKAATMNSQQMALSKDAETEWGIAWKQAQTPEEKELLMQQAVTNPLIDIEESDIGTEGPMADLAVNTMLYGHLGDKAYSNLIGGQPSSDSTTDMSNWKQYQQLKKTDPEDAKQFGQQAGFVTPEGKELSVHLQKRLSNAVDDASKSDLNIGKYKTLISDIEGANIQGGVIEGSWKEYFKDVTGNQDFVTDLRRQYAAIRGSQLVDNLPPGAASDKDIELALAGFPTDNATGKQLSSFLNGLIKLEGHKRDFNEFKSNYISEKGTEKGMLKEWRKMQKERIENPEVIRWGDI